MNDFPGMKRELVDVVDRDLKRAFGPLRSGASASTLGGQIAFAPARLHEGIDTAEALAQRVINLRDTLYGPSPRAAERSIAVERSGVIGGLLDRHDAAMQRMAEASEALDQMEREFGHE